MMGNFSKLVQVNILLSVLFVAIVFIYPIFNEEFFYKNKKKEAESVVEIIAKVEDGNFVNKNSYIPLKRDDIETLKNRFNIKDVDLEHYNFTVITHPNGYEIVAEPKTKYLKSREIAPQIYVYSKQSGKSEVKEWE